MKAIIYESGKRRWATDDGAWLASLPVGTELIYPDESSEILGGAGPDNQHARIIRLVADLVRGAVEIRVEHENRMGRWPSDGPADTPGCEACDCAACPRCPPRCPRRP